MRRPVLAAVLLCAAMATSARASQLVEITIPARGGEVTDKWLPGYTGPPRARVLLPDGYDPHRQYPLLVLMAGLSSNYHLWSDPGAGQIAKTAAGFRGIIVMPEGASGWYTDWWNGGRRGSPAWESYILDEVIPQVLDRYRIRPQRRWHALAGVSMGGEGTAYLGGRLPGFFGSIAVISGLVDVHLYPFESYAQSLIPEAYAGGPFDFDAVMGPEGGFYAYGHDPVRLAANLANTRVFMTVGDGVPTTDGQPNGNNIVTDLPAEAAIIRPASDDYARALSAANVDFTYRTHDGIHDWANFRPELQSAIRWDLFAPVDEDPTSWVNDTVATHGNLWGFAYRFDRPPDAIVRFRRSGEALSVGAAGSPVTITTRSGCVLHVVTPGTVAIPVAPCVSLAVATSPARLRRGRTTTLRVAVTPAVPGTVVRWAGAHDETDAAGVAYLRVRAPRTGRGTLVVRAPGFRSRSIAVRAR